MVRINWKDIISKALPLLPTLFIYWASYRLSVEKNAQEKKRDEFDRLNAENTRLSDELDHYRRLLTEKEREIVKLQKENAEMRKYIAGISTTSNPFKREEKEEKNEFNRLV